MSRSPNSTAPDPEFRVLIAEDIGSSRQLLAALLRQMTKVSISEANDGAAVTETHRQLRPHITFLDIGLPNKSGIEVLREIREHDESAFIVIVSAQNDSATITEAVSLSVDGFVVKPYSPQRIFEALTRYVDRVGKGAPRLRD